MREKRHPHRASETSVIRIGTASHLLRLSKGALTPRESTTENSRPSHSEFHSEAPLAAYSAQLFTWKRLKATKKYRPILVAQQRERVLKVDDAYHLQFPPFQPNHRHAKGDGLVCS
ncbi:MAG: hypothetical protein KTR18_06205 [Acidiferrobacterales bacterium]|nr:hypothetical protein [Acidiferrobacterales bacterium]